ncbi:MAG: alpha/beta fold hydrolase [Halobacteria archaeon]
MRYVNHDGRETAYEWSEKASGEDSVPVVVWVHGSGATHGIWKSQLARLPFRSAALDLSGHGESEDFSSSYQGDVMDCYVDDLDAVVKDVGADVVVGNSLGGAVVQTYLVERNHELDGVVLTGTGAKLAVLEELLDWLSSTGEFGKAVEFLHGDDMLFHDVDKRYVEDSMSEMRKVGREVTERDFRACNRFDVRGELEAIEVPTLVVGGEYDQLTPPKYHRYLSEEIPDCRLVMVEDAAHLCMLENPCDFNEKVCDFVENL